MNLLQALIDGIMIGGVYAVISVGLTLVFGVMDVINFAHGAFVMLGMLGGYLASARLGVDPLLAAPVVGVIIFALGAGLERIVIEPVITAPPIAQVMATVGVGLILENAVAASFGTAPHSVETAYQGSLMLGELRINQAYLSAFLYAVVMSAGLAAFLSRTEFGRAMRATAQNRTAATLVGINPRRIYMVAFGLGVGLSAVGGAVIMPYTVVYPQVGLNYIVIMFTIVVLGGLGSIRGAIIAGLVVGVIQATATLYLANQLQNVMVFVVFLIALFVAPGGVSRRVARG